MRLRVFELPMQHLGEASASPFCLIFDRVEDAQADMIHQATGTLKEETGAISVLAFNDAIELG